MSESVTCVACAKWSPQRCTPEMAKLGFGACERHEPWICYAGLRERDCQHFSPAADGVAEKRTEYIETQRRKAKDGSQDQETA